jgi:hypothetical protein
MLQKIDQSFVEAFISHRREWASSDDLHLRVLVGNSALIGLNLPLIALVGITERKRKILTYTQTKQKLQKKSLSDYA